MKSGCRLQSELRHAFWDLLHITISLPSVHAIVVRVNSRKTRLSAGRKARGGQLGRKELKGRIKERKKPRWKVQRRVNDKTGGWQPAAEVGRRLRGRLTGGSRPRGGQRGERSSNPRVVPAATGVAL